MRVENHIMSSDQFDELRMSSEENEMEKLSKRINKQFIYMIVNCKWDTQYEKLADSEHRDVILLTFCEEFKGDSVKSIYAPKTTWAEARNILLDAAVSGSKRQGCFDCNAVFYCDFHHFYQLTTVF